jgi:hypothetical protein
MTDDRLTAANWALPWEQIQRNHPGVDIVFCFGQCLICRLARFRYRKFGMVNVKAVRLIPGCAVIGFEDRKLAPQMWGSSRSPSGEAQMAGTGEELFEGQND